MIRFNTLALAFALALVTLASACVSPTPSLSASALVDLRPRGASAAVPTAATAATAPRPKRGWSFVIQPYISFVSIEGDVGIGRAGFAQLDIDFDDILETLELGAMLHAEAHHSNGWGVILDYAFMDLGSDISAPVGTVLDADLHQGVLEAFVTHRTKSIEGTLDVYFGVRWWDFDVDLTLSPGPDLSKDVDWVDPVFGAKLESPVATDWFFLLRGDVGGFNIESDFSWAGSIGFLHRLSESVTLELQYKALAVDYREGSRGTPSLFAYDTVTHGPMIGMSFAF